MVLPSAMTIVVGVVSAGAAVVGVSAVITAAGFGAGGIAAGSLAAKGMSLAATTGSGMGAVSVLQSVGAAGFAFATKAVIATAGAAAGVRGSRFFRGR
uniref:Interferon alpha-inducible protein 27-like protein 2A n=1 Tax=Arion vulgaris TaxID=1028688 RepID=A0A0B6ZYB8_9EUPU